MFKKTVKESFSDAFGAFQLVHHKKSYYYSFYTYFKYSSKVVKLKYDSFFAMYKRLYTPENKKFGVFARKEIFQVIAELKRKNLSNLNEEFHPTLFYVNECKNVDVHLLDPLMHIPEYKVYIIWALLLHAKERNLDSDHPLVCLADNLLESTCFMDRNNKNEMFMLLSLISADKYYPHITIDKHAYGNEECFANIIEKVLEFANITEHVSHKTYADIIPDIMIRLHREFPKDNNHSGLRYFAKRLSDIPEARALFFKILTLDGTTMEYITRIVQSTQGIEKTHSADGCKGYINVFLMWIIQNTSESQRNHWCAMIKRCYDLIDVTELKKRKSIDFSSLWGHSVYIISLLKGIKYIVCVEHDAKSMERFESIKELFSKFRRW
ncbi:hypothetical protein NEAUS03_1599 [Nematocida ausubeli]|nr:hypothetical protein NEAUS03_1599 [Nematocida ausubeli]